MALYLQIVILVKLVASFGFVGGGGGAFGLVNLPPPILIWKDPNESIVLPPLLLEKVFTIVNDTCEIYYTPNG